MSDFRHLALLSPTRAAHVLGLRGAGQVQRLVAEGRLETRELCGTKLITVASILRLVGELDEPRAEPERKPLSQRGRSVLHEMRGGA